VPPALFPLRGMSRKWLPIRKGYDHCPIGHFFAVGICRKWLPIRKGYDRFTNRCPSVGPHDCRKWLPIRKGYDSLPPGTSFINSISRKWLPIRKGYDDHVTRKGHMNLMSKMASDSEGLRQVIYISGVFPPPSKMASDSEGLRLPGQPCHEVLQPQSKMASDSEGLRLYVRSLGRDATVENGFRFGRVTTQGRLMCSCS